MTVAQGINKITVYKSQSGLGVPANGSGGQILRRRTSEARRNRATYVNDEIVQHQQSTGVNLGSSTTEWNYDGLLSSGTFSALFQALLRKDFTATSAVTGLSITIAGSGPYTLTDGGADFLAAGLKIGDVVRITAGTYSNPVNRDNNLLITGLTATVITCITLNGTALIAEGPIASSTVTVIGKKTMAPLTGHTDTLFTIEEWYEDLGRSELFPDMRMGETDINLPATGNAGVRINGMGLGVRTLSNAQVLTTPNPATETGVLTAVRGLLVHGGTALGTVTGLSMKISPNLLAEGPIVGSNYPPDMSRGRVEVTGQFTALFDSATLGQLYDAETLTSLIGVFSEDTTNTSNFVSFSIGALKLTNDQPDDGEKAIVRTYPFTAQLNTAGGPALANDKTIITIQDSQAA